MTEKKIENKIKRRNVSKFSIQLVSLRDYFLNNERMPTRREGKMLEEKPFELSKPEKWVDKPD